MTALPQHLLDIVPNAVHVHSKAGFVENDCQGEQTLEEIDSSARNLGMTEVYLTEHTTNPAPGKPHSFEPDIELADQMRARFWVVESQAQRLGSALYAGLEANIMPDGTLDVPSEVSSDAVLVIASMHGEVPKTGGEAFNRLGEVMRDRNADVLGHPQRYVDVYDVDWEVLFEGAAAPNWPTVVEANFNAWFTYGPVKLRRKGDEEGAIEAEKKEIHFLQALGRSAAPVVVSLDIHNAGMWPAVAPEADWMPTFEHLERYIDLLIGCGIDQERIINRNLREWLLLPKSDRGKLMTWL